MIKISLHSLSRLVVVHSIALLSTASTPVLGLYPERTLPIESQRSSRLSPDNEGRKQSPTVAVIGCGPGGVFFLHALASRRRSMELSGDVAGLESLPASVTCYDKSSNIGGVWNVAKRSDDYTAATFNITHDHDVDYDDNEANINMYEGLWTNGPKELFEFADYTYDEHFGRNADVPTFLPRQHVLEYVVARVTRNNPTFFDNVRLDTKILSVVYNDDMGKFVIKSRNEKTGEEATSLYDKCIWAAGINGRAYIPAETDEILKKGGYRGQIFHSSKVGSIDFGRAVTGKRVLLVGGGLSADDLALQSIKLGVEKVYIQSRSGTEEVDDVTSWPLDKVELLQEMALVGVVQRGRGLRFKTSERDPGSRIYTVEDGGATKVIEDIDTIIYCTGYDTNFDMLDEELSDPFSNPTPFRDVPKNWQMKPNVLTSEFKHVQPSDEIDVSDWSPISAVGIYRGVLLMSNPNMMFISHMFDAPLFETDVHAWLCLAFLTGDVETPSYEVMERRNAQNIMGEMDDLVMRSDIDANFRTAWNKMGSNHWSRNARDPRVLDMSSKWVENQLKRIARNMLDARYPDDIGTEDNLNEKGRALLKIDLSSSKSLDIKGGKRETYRDTQPLPTSVHTGTVASQLRKLWLDLTNDDYSDLLRKGNHKVRRRLKAVRQLTQISPLG